MSLVILVLVVAAYLVSVEGPWTRALSVADITSDVDGKEYVVRKSWSRSNMVEAANYLAGLAARVDRLVEFMSAHGVPSAEVAERLRDRWSRCMLRETGPRSSKLGVTVDKDREIQLCIRNPRGGFEDPNMSMFVVLHELAHVMSVSYDHEPEFYENFDAVTKAAVQIGVYEPEDFTKTPRSYCGAEISNTPCADGACSLR